MNNYEHLIDGIGLWSEMLSKNDNIDGKPALFLDRDGTIVKEQKYLHEPISGPNGGNPKNVNFSFQTPDLNSTSTETHESEKKI